MQTIARVDGVVTKATACLAARQEYARQFQAMATSNEAWHLYACRDGLAIAQGGVHLVCLVPNVHAATIQQVVNTLCNRLDWKGTPFLWIREAPAPTGSPLLS